MSQADSRTTEHVPEWKKEEVQALVDLIERYDSVGVVDVTGIPSRQLQDMRRGLHGTAEIRMGRNSLIERALDQVDEGVEALSEYVYGQVGLVGTDANPFTLYRELEASKTPAPISAGEITPDDIVIEAGDTGVDPGPFVGELQQVGADARIQDGSIQVTSDSTVLEAGGEVSSELANVLNELGIQPKEVGLDLRSVYAEGVLFEPEELALDVDQYRADIETAVARGRNLSVNAVYPTDRTATTLLSKARGEATSLGLQAAIESPDLAEDLVSKADAQVRALAAAIDDEEALPEELRDADSPADAGGAESEAEAEDEESDAGGEQADEDATAESEDDEDDEDDGDVGDGMDQMFG